MATTREASPASTRRPARDLIELVLEHMRNNLEPLKYSTLAPSRYLVYLHPAEHARLEGILGIIQHQTIRALNEELASLNDGTGLARYARRVWKRPFATVENAAPEWHVEFLVDPDGDLQPGDVLVDSELMLPPGPELGVGARTRRIATVYTGSRVAREATAPERPAYAEAPAGKPMTAEAPVAKSAPLAATVPTLLTPLTQPSPAPPSSAAPQFEPAPMLLATAPPPLPTAVHAAPRALARISYEDDAGPHEYAVIKASVSIGRGGVAYPVDVRITSSTDVSREHARIRHDAETGRFCLIDLSSLGTTVDGAPVPRGYDDADGTKRENGVEVVLPPRARIGLANLVFLDFRVER
ncbi:MAG TPA: FHA domain-containing protein [Vicinamibacterales bacterium]|nr:FHA domain-containing protein [Vicinamibacterales bacterium]